ncbi:hypothetical protein C8R44DRAFT_745372 [Mycena epipterygia]|nr:hypothetical protein C8R44DRAFT_745372 [Mycena epipterygia]
MRRGNSVGEHTDGTEHRWTHPCDYGHGKYRRSTGGVWYTRCPCASNVVSESIGETGFDSPLVHKNIGCDFFFRTGGALPNRGLSDPVRYSAENSEQHCQFRVQTSAARWEDRINEINRGPKIPRKRMHSEAGSRTPGAHFSPDSEGIMRSEELFLSGGEKKTELPENSDARNRTSAELALYICDDLFVYEERVSSVHHIPFKDLLRQLSWRSKMKKEIVKASDAGSRNLSALALQSFDLRMQREGVPFTTSTAYPQLCSGIKENFYSEE